MDIQNYLLTALAFGVIIFIHESGHFLAAKRVGIRVEKFYLGFDFWGLKIFSFKFRETEYGIGIFPLGGYVKMAGQEDFGRAETEGKPDEFTSKTVWQRAQVLAGGVVFNFISAFFFCFLALLAGYKLMSTEVGHVDAGSPAWHMGLQEGDHILAYNGIPVESFEALKTEVALTGAGQPVKVKYKRDGQIMTAQLQPEIAEMGLASIGLEPAASLVVSMVQPDSGAQKAGLLPGDKIAKVNDVSINQWEELAPLLKKIGPNSKQIKLTVERKGQPLVLDVELTKVEEGILGVQPEMGPVRLEKIKPKSAAELAGLSQGMELKTVNGLSVWDYLESDSAVLASPMVLRVSDGDKEREIVFNGNFKIFSSCAYFKGGPESTPLSVLATKPGSVAEKMGLLKGDLVKSVMVEGGKEVLNPKWMDLRQLAMGNPGKTVRLQIQRGQGTINMDGVIGTTPDPRYMMGIVRGNKTVEHVSMRTVLTWPFSMLRMGYKSLWALVSGIIPKEHISGPVGIIRVTYHFTYLGIDYLLYLMALISIHIAFFNILPLPVLDGGHLMFCLIEAIKGSPVKQVWMNRLQYAGLVLLLCVLVFATYNDTKAFFQ